VRNLRRVSIGAFVFVAMILGVRVGSLIYQARVQRDIVSAIRLNRGVGLLDVCGEVFYNWEMTDGGRRRGPGDHGEPPAPKWLVNCLGVDFFWPCSRSDSATGRGGHRRADCLGWPADWSQ
jgi:hypothetical protein